MLEEPLGGGAISPLLHQNIQDDTMLIDGAPQVVFRRGTVTPDRLPKVTPSDRRFRKPHRWDARYLGGSLFKADRVPD